MGFKEGYAAEIEGSESSLEKFKENPDTPFLTVDKKETPKEYPYLFLNRLKANWSKTCQLMGWQKGGIPIDLNFFRVAKDPVEVVMSIQEKILEKKGALPRFGKDGKFGQETETALSQVVSTLAVAPTQTVEVADSMRNEKARKENENDVLTKTEKNDPLERWKSPEGMTALVEAMPRVEQRIRQAGVQFDRGLMEKLMETDAIETDVMEYQTRAMAFRENLVLEEPLFRPWNHAIEKTIPFFEEEIQEFDFSTVKSIRELDHEMEKLGERCGRKMLSIEKSFDEPAMQTALAKANPEILMAFFITIVHEFMMIIMKKQLKDKANFERLLNLFREEMGS